jgi:LPXTG-motif cell wall-anchored protein
MMTGALFSTPFKMDETDAEHLMIGGREIFETTRGAGTSSSTWKQVFDLGTHTKPGEASATAGAGDPVNAESAIDVRGDAAYVGYCGYCGYCDIVTGGLPFESGIATNVGGADPPSAGTKDGWHIAAAKGLPKRYITSVAIDPKNAKTVYVTLGGYGRRWIPPGSLGDDVSKVGKGHVYTSTDAGATFKDVSGDLPDLPANHVLPYDGHLIVSTDVGVFVSSGTTGGAYKVLGSGLPKVQTFEVSVSPRNHKELVAATYGRTVWTTIVGDLGKTSTPTTPAKPTRPASGGGSLPATGAAPWIGAGALSLIGAALFLRRRQHI